MKQIDIQINSQKVGTLTKVGEKLSFQYSDSWCQSGKALHRALPIQVTPHLHREVFLVFENILPEGEALQEALRETGLTSKLELLFIPGQSLNNWEFVECSTSLQKSKSR